MAQDCGTAFLQDALTGNNSGHIGCYGLTEAAWSAVTNKGIIRIYDIVGDVKKISFINVYF